MTDDIIEECEHNWVSYSRPPMRAVTGRQCKKCKVIIDGARTDKEAMAELQQAVQRKFFEDLAKLKRYEEREPLVQALLRIALTQDAVENFEELVDKRASAVRDFKLSSPAPAMHAFTADGVYVSEDGKPFEKIDPE